MKSERSVLFQKGTRMRILLVRPPVPRQTIGLKHVMICEPLELEYVAAESRSRLTAIDITSLSVTYAEGIILERQAKPMQAANSRPLRKAAP